MSRAFTSPGAIQSRPCSGPKPVQRRAQRAEVEELRLLLAEDESICTHVSRYAARLRPALAGLAGVADELARSAGFASALRSAVVQDRVVRALAAAIDRTWAGVATRGSR